MHTGPSSPPDPESPPVPTVDGRPRMVGVEIEFGDLTAEAAAGAVQATVGGRLRHRDAHAVEVRDSRIGTISVELDSQYAHPQDTLDKLGEVTSDALRRRLTKLVREAGELAGDVARHWLPMEVVCPPLPWSQLGEADALVAALRAAGATDTREAAWYAFGLQLNPELPARDATSLRRHLQAFALLEDWLRACINPDRMRQLLPFIDRWPKAYCRRILSPGYAPDLEALCRDYLADNTSRNRSLDMLPAFLELCPAVVRAATDNPLIKARPTFHYRLPDASFDPAADGCGAVLREWNRWLVVERLAADPARLEDIAARWRANDSRLFPADWAEIAAPLIAPLVTPPAAGEAAGETA